MGTPTTLWAIPVSDLGGVARHALDVARAGIPGWRTVFLVPEGPLAAQLRATGAEVSVGAFGPDHGLRHSLGTLRGALARLRPQVLHTHLAYADIAGALARPGGAALVTTEHGLAENDAVYHRTRLRSRARAGLHRLRFARTDALIAVSHATLRVARRKWHLPSRVHATVLPNGIDRGTPGQRRPGLHVVSLARFAPEKRLDDLVSGFAVLAAEEPTARLTLAGEGELVGQIRDQVARLGLTERVHLPGHVPAQQLLAEADVLALLSVWENCSYALLDALAQGVGVVASPVGGNPEIVPPRCLVLPEDPTAVSAALRTQGTDLAARPSLTDWPDVAEMTRGIAGVYAEVGR